MSAESRAGRTAVESVDLSVPRAALIAGAGLLLMAVVSMVSLPLVEGFLVPGDAAGTATNILESETLFRIAVAGLLVVILLDVVIAWALYVFLRPVSPSLSLLAMLFRLLYAAVFGAALSFLLAISGLLGGATSLAAFDTGQLHALVLLNYHAFEYAWDVGLAISGIHLLVVGYLAIKSEYVPNVVGAFLLIAGGGYALDSFATFLLEGYALEITLFTFVGEVVFLVWLLYRGRTVDLHEAASGAA